MKTRLIFFLNVYRQSEIIYQCRYTVWVWLINSGRYAIDAKIIMVFQLRLIQTDRLHKSMLEAKCWWDCRNIKTILNSIKGDQMSQCFRTIWWNINHRSCTRGFCRIPDFYIFMYIRCWLFYVVTKCCTPDLVLNIGLLCFNESLDCITAFLHQLINLSGKFLLHHYE